MRARLGLIPRLWRHTPAIALATAAAVLFAAIGLVFYIDRSYTAEKLGELTVQARILASTMSAAMEFGDQKAAQEYVDAIRANPDLQAAAVYNAHGQIFVSYPHAPGQQLPGPGSATGASQGQLTVAAPIALPDGSAIGTAYLRAAIEPLSRRVLRYLVFTLLALMAALVLGVLAVAHTALAHANQELEQRAADLADAYQRLQGEIGERERVEGALRQAQKMEAVGQLTGGVAHDFNNLLQIIMGSLDRLRVRWERQGEFKPGDASFDRLTGAAMESARRAATLTQRLLAFSRRQTLAPRSLDVNRLIDGMHDMLVRTLGEAVEVTIRLAPAPCWVHVDENQLENALLNLAVNARDAMAQPAPGGSPGEAGAAAAGGRLTIETAHVQVSGTGQPEDEAELAPGDYVTISVSDTGTGMTGEVMAKAFEPFFTTKGIGKGSGLGLSQVYGFIRQSGGQVRIDSEVGQGTSVRLILPRMPAGEADSASPAAPQALPGGRPQECVLVVEDEPEVRALSVAALQELGYRVLEAGDGNAALHVLERTAKVHLLFTDVGLPGGMTGRQLADEARRRWPGLKVLFTTGYSSASLLHQGRLERDTDIIGKPFAIPELAQKARALLDGEAART